MSSRKSMMSSCPRVTMWWTFCSEPFVMSTIVPFAQENANG